MIMRFYSKDMVKQNLFQGSFPEPLGTNMQSIIWPMVRWYTSYVNEEALYIYKQLYYV